MNKYLRLAILGVWYVFSLPVNSFAAAPPLLTYLGIEQGLSNNAVTSIYQDHNGFMWFGTYDGLNRYDGYNFTVYRNEFNDSNSLVNNRIACITEDHHKRLWIGTRGGISIYNNATGRFSGLPYLPYKSTKEKKILVPVNAVLPGANETIFIGTNGEGLLVYNPSGPARQAPLRYRDDLITHYEVSSITIDASGHTWLFVRSIGLCIYDNTSGVVRVINDNIRNGIALQADHKGQLWLGTDEGLYKYTVAANTFTSMLSTHNKRVVHLITDRYNTLWIASDGEGVFMMPLSTEKITRLASPENKELLTSTAVFSIFEDHEGRKWIGTLRGGVNILDPGKAGFARITHDPLNPNSLINDFTLSLCEDVDHNIWIGTDGGGLSIWNRKQNQFTNFRHLAGNDASLCSDFVTSITRDFQNNIWISTWGTGIYRYNKAKRSFDHYTCFNQANGTEDKNTWLLYEDAAKTLWAGVCTGSPLYRYNRETNRFEVFDSRLTNILSMAEDNKGDFWAGDYTSLIKIDRTTKHHQTYNIGYPVRVFHQDKAGNCWIGTEGGGLLLFNRETGTYVRYTKADGLSNNSILKILEDKSGNLWISTFYGISKFNPRQKTFKNYSQSDGLLSNQLNYNAALALPSGEFIFGGLKGLNIFYPDSLPSFSGTPGILLTGLKVDNIPIEQAARYVTGRTTDHITSLKIPYNKAVLAFDFVSPEYSAPDKIDYAYYLDGWDKGWNYVGKSRTANYTRLHEGNYTFRIKTTNTEGVWNTREYTLQITILPPWYRTWWAYLLYLAAIAGMAYTYLQYKAQKTKAAFDIRLARLETEKEKELNEKKLAFFTNISHEFRTPLTLIINPVKELLNHSDKTPGNGLEVVYRNARRLLSLVDQLLLFRKADSEMDRLKITRLDFHNLCREVYLSFSQQAKAKQIDYIFNCSTPQLEVYADREKIEIVLFNLLSNALKFTPENGTVSFIVDEDGETITVNITDTGCGISEDAGQRLFEKFYQVKEKQTSGKAGFGIGLYLSKHFIESHKGGISFTSSPGQGTSFTVQLRKGTSHFAGQYIFEEMTDDPAMLEELMGNITSEISLERPGADNEQSPLEDIFTSKRSILVVDDNAEIRGYLQLLFREKFIFLEADNGEDGLKLAREHYPDIIISDVLMKGMDGMELCNTIKQDPTLSHIPVILLTGNPSQEIKLKGIECGADDYITKPFEQDLLLARIENILQNRNALQGYFFDKITLKKNDARISTEYKHFLERCITVVEDNLDKDTFNIKMLAAEIGMSHSNLYKKVKSISGHSVNAFIRFIRLRRAAVLLLSTDCNVNEAAFGVGLNDMKYFRKQFSKLFGMNPSEYIKKYRSSFNKDFNVVNWKE
ncbi:two-component regulator propeller domain-containing protein [Chitinophaga sp. CF418]|uniref:two-component regulator propeller domain-containing protein n=1 Tax=Chitinophaga sp. CF418 TaxID=1855287 RepID=UPI000919190F|nr:two-component regulator propeller domain-containing protein [Chitinophaga sp. CF418]SHN40429.1 Two component regulator propeller [Chitinophaga sp. CF418]